VSAKAGTTPAIDFDIETSDNQTDWHTLAQVPQVNDPTIPSGGSYRHPVVQLTNMGAFIRIHNPDGMASGTSLTIQVDVDLKN